MLVWSFEINSTPTTKNIRKQWGTIKLYKVDIEIDKVGAVVDDTHQQHAVDDVRRRRVAALQELGFDAASDGVEGSEKGVGCGLDQKEHKKEVSSASSVPIKG